VVRKSNNLIEFFVHLNSSQLLLLLQVLVAFDLVGAHLGEPLVEQLLLLLLAQLGLDRGGVDFERHIDVGVVAVFAQPVDGIL